MKHHLAPNRSSALTSAAFALLLLPLAAAAPSVVAQSTISPAPRYVELPNLHRVNERLYRSAQPRFGGLRRLDQLGIETIINLRGADEHARAEEAEARALGLRYHNIPFRGHSRPTDEQIERVLAIIDDPASGIVLVHCKRGADRTGTVMAIYRMTHDGWTSERARAEANRRGMRWTQVEMKDYIADYYRERIVTNTPRNKKMQFADRVANGMRRVVERSLALTRRGIGQSR